MNNQANKKFSENTFHFWRFFNLCILLLTLLGFKCYAEDKQKECIETDIIKTILSDFKINELGNDGKIKKSYNENDNCHSGFFKTLVLSLQLIRSSKSVPVQNKIKSPIYDTGAYEYLRKNVKVINLRKKDGDQCKNGEYAYVEIDNVIQGRSNQINMCYTSESMEIYYLAYIIMHESAHTSGKDHISCSHGVFYGALIKQCDQRIEKEGANSVGYAFLSLVYADTTDMELKRKIRQVMLLDILNRFNSPPFNLRRGALLVDANNVITFYDGNQEHKLASFEDEIAGATLWGAFPLVFMKNGKIFRYEFSEQWIEVKGVYSETYKKLLQSERDEITDVYINGLEICAITFFKVMCGSHGDAPKEMKSLGGYMFHDTYQASKSDYVLVSMDGEVFVFSPLKAARKNNKYTDEYESSQRADLEMYYNKAINYIEFINGTFIGLSDFGEFLFKKSIDEEWTADNRFGKRKFKKILPFYWSAELEQL